MVVRIEAVEVTQDKGSAGNAASVPRAKHGGSALLIASIAAAVVAFAALGGVIGLYAGMSKTPVVVTLLPLFFALLTGAGGLQLAAGDLSRSAGLTKILSLALAITALSLTTFGGTLYGALLRTGAPACKLIPGSSCIETKEIPDLLLQTRSLASAVEGALLDRQLLAVGASEAVRAHILQLYVSRYADLDPPIEGKRLAAAVGDDAATLLGRLREVGPAGVSPETATLIENLRNAVNVIQVGIGGLSEPTGSPGDVLSIVKTWKTSIYSLPEGTMTWLNSKPDVRVSYEALRFSLSEWQSILSARAASYVSTYLKDLDAVATAIPARPVQDQGLPSLEINEAGQ